VKPGREKKDGTNIFGDARAGRPVTQLVLKLSAGGFHLNRSTQDRRNSGTYVAQIANFLSNFAGNPEDLQHGRCILNFHFRTTGY
jgi:hypothetical protein